MRDIGYDVPGAIADLVDNAIDANARNVAIEIVANGPDSWIRVSDDGIGMSPSRLDEAMRYGTAGRVRAACARTLRPRTQDRVAVAVPPSDRRVSGA